MWGDFKRFLGRARRARAGSYSPERPETPPVSLRARVDAASSLDAEDRGVNADRGEYNVEMDLAGSGEST